VISKNESGGWVFYSGPVLAGLEKSTRGGGKAKLGIGAESKKKLTAGKKGDKSADWKDWEQK